LKTLVFATQNSFKIEEINHILESKTAKDQLIKWKIIGLADIHCQDDIPETSNTLEGNALQKALYIKKHYGHDCFADDTGFEIDALDGRPGVFSARYAGPQRNFDDNIQKVLEELNGLENRTACFRTVITLLMGSEQRIFEGRVEGRIIHEKRGKSGFGYDPVFIPAGHDKTFAEMTLEEKNKISHRAKAIMKLIEHLKSYDGR
jgi:XTP/dITP diphosphohydrolase